MRFASVQQEAEFTKRLHPSVRMLLEALDDWCLESSLPQVVVTSLGRSFKENQAAGGVTHSWHLYNCAADFRSQHYTDAQREQVWAWLQQKCPKPDWELLQHAVPGGAPHFHVARRDLSWRNTFDKRPANA